LTSVISYYPALEFKLSFQGMSIEAMTSELGASAAVPMTPEYSHSITSQRWREHVKSVPYAARSHIFDFKGLK
jgi:hypothetical protein